MTAPLGAVEYKEGSVIDVLVVEAIDNDVDVAITSGAQIGTLIIKTNSTYETNVDIQDGAFVREIIIAGNDGQVNTDPTNLTLTVAEGAAVKASTRNDNDTKNTTTITGIPYETPTAVIETCANHNHDWASQPGLLVEFCKKCGTKRVTTVTSNTPTEEVTVTTTYNRTSNEASAIISAAENNTNINANYTVEEEVTVEIEKEDYRPTGYGTKTTTNSSGTITELINPGQPTGGGGSGSNPEPDLLIMNYNDLVNFAQGTENFMGISESKLGASFDVPSIVDFMGTKTLDLNGFALTGTITSQGAHDKRSVIYVCESAELTINDSVGTGVIQSSMSSGTTTTYAINNYGKPTVNGGKYIGGHAYFEDYGIDFWCDAVGGHLQEDTIINGDTFINQNPAESNSSNQSVRNCTINGGLFSHKPSDSIVKSGYQISSERNADGYYTVVLFEDEGESDE